MIKFSLKYVGKSPIDNNPALVQITAWRRSGDKPLSEPMMVSLLMHICVTRPQWVKESRQYMLYKTYLAVWSHAPCSGWSSPVLTPDGVTSGLHGPRGIPASNTGRILITLSSTQGFTFERECSANKSNGIEQLGYVTKTIRQWPLLTHWGLVTPCGDRDLGLHWLRLWLVAWRYQAITWTNVDWSSVKSSYIHISWFILGQFHKWCLNHQSLKSVWKLHV